MTDDKPAESNRLNEIQREVEVKINEFDKGDKGYQREHLTDLVNQTIQLADEFVSLIFKNEEATNKEREDFKSNTIITWLIKIFHKVKHELFFNLSVLPQDASSRSKKKAQQNLHALLDSLKRIEEKEIDFAKSLNSHQRKVVYESFIKIILYCKKPIGNQGEILEENNNNIILWIEEFLTSQESLKQEQEQEQEQEQIEIVDVHKEEEFPDNVKETSDFLTGLMKSLQGEHEKAEKAKDEIKKTTKESIKELQKQTNLNVFAREAEMFKNAARRYFITAIIFLVLAVTSLGGLFYIAIFQIYEKQYTFENITTGRTMLIVLLLTALGIGMRGYFLNSHNEAHNRHRSNVLRSYKNIYDNTGDTDKKEVVTQTLSAAFQQLPTGFSKQQGEGGAGGFISFLSRFFP